MPDPSLRSLIRPTLVWTYHGTWWTAHGKEVQKCGVGASLAGEVAGLCVFACRASSYGQGKLLRAPIGCAFSIGGSTTVKPAPQTEQGLAQCRMICALRRCHS